MIAQIWDTETTDLINNMAVKLEQQPEIISLFYSLVDLDTGIKIKDENFLFKPSKPIREEITKINGITNEMVENAPPFSSVHLILKEEFEFAEMSIAHNLPYDRDMINIEMQRCNEIVKWPRRMICTVEQTMHFKGYRLSLTNLYKELFGLDFEEKHSASGDVAALIKCCVELRRLKCL